MATQRFTLTKQKRGVQAPSPARPHPKPAPGGQENVSQESVSFSLRFSRGHDAAEGGCAPQSMKNRLRNSVLQLESAVAIIFRSKRPLGSWTSPTTMFCCSAVAVRVYELPSRFPKPIPN